MAATPVLNKNEQAERSIIDMLATLNDTAQATAHYANLDLDLALDNARNELQRAQTILTQIQQEQAQPVVYYRLAA